jgi:hypothetical protein
MEFLLTVAIFVAVMAVTGLLFGGWVIVTIARIIGTVLGGRRRAFSAGVLCPNARCRQSNPAGAAYCRRCGRSLDAAAGREPRIAIRA